MAATALWLLLLLPASAGGLLLVAGRRADRLAGPLAVAASAAALALSAWAWAARPSAAATWLPLPGGGLELTLAAGGAAGAFACLVAAMTLLVGLYAAGFLDRGEARARFFGFFLLFSGAMQAIVLAEDLLLLLIGWEIVGACSFALIGFWHRESGRVFDARRAFVVTRSADLGLYLATMAAIAAGGSAALGGLAGLAEPARGLVALGLIVAAAGKSAQLPFAGWLRGAMAGPTPVSALLHSAAMVAAGVILLVKVSPLLEAVAWAGPLVLWTGVATMLAGAAIALAETDVKRLLAASTVSNYGYLFAGVGAAALPAAGSYLVAHAAFKALLFLAAGLLVRQAVHELPVPAERQRAMPRAALLAGAGALALAALPPTGAYLAKDALLAGVKEAGLAAWLLLLLGSLLTAGYATRLYLLAFGAARPGLGAGGPEDARGPLWLPCLLLAAAGLLFALPLLPPLEQTWTQALGLGPLPPPKPAELALSFALASLGAGAAWLLHRRGRLLAPPMAGLRAPAEAWFGLEAGLDRVGAAVAAAGGGLARLDRPLPAGTFDRLATGSVPRPLAPEEAVGRAVAALARGVAALDRRATDPALVGWPVAGTFRLARASRRSDRSLLDGALGALAAALQATAGRLSLLQSGKLHHYYAQMAAGWALLIVCASLLFWT